MIKVSALAIGGLFGAFYSSFALIIGTNNKEVLIFSLFLAAVSGCLVLIIEGKKQLLKQWNHQVRVQINNLNLLAKVTLGASLAVSFITLFSKAIQVLSIALSISKASAAISCSLLLVSYIFTTYILIISNNSTGLQHTRNKQVKTIK